MSSRERIGEMIPQPCGDCDVRSRAPAWTRGPKTASISAIRPFFEEWPCGAGTDANGRLTVFRGTRMTSRRIAFLSAIVFLTTFTPASPRSQTGADILPFRATETTLANGLRVIVVPTGFPNLVGVQIPVQTGSRNEIEPGKSGFAHFFEHLMFRGTPTNPPARFRQIMTRAGARAHASTRDDT